MPLLSANLAAMACSDDIAIGELMDGLKQCSRFHFRCNDAASLKRHLPMTDIIIFVICREFRSFLSDAASFADNFSMTDAKIRHPNDGSNDI